LFESTADWRAVAPANSVLCLLARRPAEAVTKRETIVARRVRANWLSLSRTAQGHRQAHDGGDNPSDDHPNGLVSGRSSKEPGNVGAERFGGLNSENHEHDSTYEQNNGKHFIHKELSISPEF